MIARITDIETRDIPAIGQCEICGKYSIEITRTYFKFEEIKCKCHSPYHFELIEHCKDCVPEEPVTTEIDKGNNIYEVLKCVNIKKRIKKLERILKYATSSL